jgi:hypothetical protein
MSAWEYRFDKDTVRLGDDNNEERDVMTDINPKGKYDG